MANNRIYIKNHPKIQIPLQPGYSGCPIWDCQQKGVTGIIAQTSSSQRIGTFIPTDLVKPIIAKNFPELLSIFISEKMISESLEDQIIGANRFSDRDRELLRIQEISNIRIKLKESGAISPDELKKLNWITQKIMEMWQESREFYKYKKHKTYFNFSAIDDFHSANMELVIYKILSSLIDGIWVKNKRTVLVGEGFSFVFLLLASAWLHDIGLISALLKKDSFEGTYQKTTFLGSNDHESESDELIGNEYISILENHHMESMNYIDNNKQIFNLSEKEVTQLTRICELHRHKDYLELHKESEKFKKSRQSNEPNIALITSYLRLADALHMPRKTQDVKSYMALGLDDSFAKFQWLKSQMNARLSIEPDDFKVGLILRIPRGICDSIRNNNPSDSEIKLRESVENLRELIEIELKNEIDSLINIIIDGKLNIYYTATCDIEPCPQHPADLCNQRSFEALLNDVELFGPRMSPNASAVTAVVLNQIKSIMSGNCPEENINTLEEYNNTVLNKIRAKRPCYVFLHKVANFLSEILSISKDNRNYEQLQSKIKEKLKEWQKKNHL